MVRGWHNGLPRDRRISQPKARCERHHEGRGGSTTTPDDTFRSACGPICCSTSLDDSRTLGRVDSAGGWAAVRQGVARSCGVRRGLRAAVLVVVLELSGVPGRPLMPRRSKGRPPEKERGSLRPGASSPSARTNPFGASRVLRPPHPGATASTSPSRRSRYRRSAAFRTRLSAAR